MAAQIITFSPAAAAALVLLMALVPLFSAGGDERPAPMPAGMPDYCVTLCGDVQLHYRLGLGQEGGCSRPGFSLACNNSAGSLPPPPHGIIRVLWIDVTAPMLHPQDDGHLKINVDDTSNRGATRDGPYRASIHSSKHMRIMSELASGMGLVLFALVAYFIYNKRKHQRAQRLKWKYFERNRGKLLQQLAPQRADIAENMILTLEELEKATNSFDKAHELGGGGHGTVYKGILSDLHVVAIKKAKILAQREIDEFINEVSILSQINHRNVVKLYGCCLQTDVPILVYEFISNGTLYDHLHVEGPRSLSWDDRIRIATETAKALAYLHSTTSIPIIHRDIKPANILLDDKLTAKVADFGASRYIPMDKSYLTTMVQGTLGYLDPMYLHAGRLTEKSDVYSFGVILIELLTRKKPFTYMSSEGNGLVAQFDALFAQGNLSQILDPQVIHEGGNGIREIARTAVACVKLR